MIKKDKTYRIRNLVFDFGGVLVDLDRQRCIDQFKQLGAIGIGDMLSDYSKEGFFQDYEEGEITSIEFRDKLRKQAGRFISDEDLDKAWCSFLIGIPTFKLDTLLRLREHYVIYLLSNTNQIHWQWSCENLFPYKGFSAEDYFEKIYLSFEMHDAKPSSSIFKRVLTDTDILPEETLFLDDSQENCAVAESLGIHTKLVNPCEDWTIFFSKDGDNR